MIDDAYTLQVQSQRQAGGEFAHRVFTDDELDWLLEEGAHDVTGGITKLAEAAIERSTGLRVDLSLEGPARTAVVKAGNSVDQEHNTFTIVEDGHNARDLSRITRDRGSIPKITPQDANIAVRSIDFPAARARGTPLDKMRIDDKDNPVEATFINQLTCAQVLYMWGVNIDDLIEAINAEWGVDFSRQLVQDVAFARLADLEKFIASGGRPSPTIYMSPNVLSSYTFSNKPTVDPRMVGYSATFTGRMRALGKFIMATASQLRGNHCASCLSYHMNPAHMSRFRVVDLMGWHIEVMHDHRLNALSSALTNKKSFEEFVGARQAASVALANERTVIAKAMISADYHERSVLTGGFGRMQDAPKDRLIMRARIAEMKSIPAYRDSAPRKLSAILFDIYNGTPSSNLYLSCLSACAMMTCLGCVIPSRTNLPAVWRPVLQSRGLGDCLKTVNVASADKNLYLRRVMKSTVDASKKDVLRIVLVRRHLDHIRPSVSTALDLLHIEYKKKHKYDGKWQNATFRGRRRPWIMFQHHLQGNHKPYSQLNRFRRSATITSADSSLVELGTRVIRNLLESDRPDYRSIKPLGAGLRDYWARYYNEACRSWQLVTYVGMTMTSADFDIRLVPPRGRKHYQKVARNSLWIVCHMAYVEMVFYQAMTLCYTWCQVSVGAGCIAALTAKDPEVTVAFTYSMYVDYLKQLESDKPEFYVQMVRGAFEPGTASHKDLQRRATFLMTGYPETNSYRKNQLANVMKDIISMMDGAIDRVRSTVEEALYNDASALREMISKLAAPVSDTVSDDMDTHNSVGDDSDAISVVDEGPTNSTNSTSDGLNLQQDIWDMDVVPEDEINGDLARMVAISEQAVDDDQESNLVHGLQDRLVSFATDVMDFDPELEFQIEEMWPVLTNDMYLENVGLFDSISEDLERMMRFRDIELQNEITADFRDNIQKLSGVTGRGEIKRDIMN
jgi:hypothetical protein